LPLRLSAQSKDRAPKLHGIPRLAAWALIGQIKKPEFTLPSCASPGVTGSNGTEGNLFTMSIDPATISSKGENIAKLYLFAKATWYFKVGLHSHRTTRA